MAIASRLRCDKTRPAPHLSDRFAKTPSRLAPDMAEAKTILPPHIESTIAAIAQLHAEHHQRATPFQRFTESLTASAGQPRFVAWLTFAVAGWILVNLLLMLLGYRPFDAPPFAWLEGAVSLAALYMTVLILSTQRRDDELASHREQLTLELAILGDQKAAKIIELLEELRRDHPEIHDRIDHDARAMSTPADPQAVFEAIEDSHEETLKQR
jgi:uncharacterized membrane protein